MRQFYDVYKDNTFASALLTQLTCSNHLLIVSGAKSIEEKEFYLSLSVKEKYTYRELDRQISSAYYHRYMLSKQNDALIDVFGDSASSIYENALLNKDKFIKNVRKDNEINRRGRCPHRPELVQSVRWRHRTLQIVFVL
jgi:hypothetical protein